MAKGDDAIRKKKNKANRKKMQNDASKVSNRIAAIIAQKKRRQSGKRRMCQGMCFSLPTPEDPFNDKEMNLDSKKKDKRKDTKKIRPPKGANNLSENGNGTSPKKRKLDVDHASEMSHQQKRKRMEKEQKNISKLGSGRISEVEGCPSNFLISCLKSIQDSMQQNETCNIELEQPLFFNSWGFEYWKCYSSGRNVLETSGSCSTMEQIAWTTSTAVDTITTKEKEGVSFTSPFLLFLVPSQEKAAKVRAVCKPLKAVGIHTVSLHPGASIDHQINGLEACEPEFIVCTPDRLLELVSMEAVDISGVCSLIVDGLDFSSKSAYLDKVKSIRQHISGDPHIVVFSSSLSDASLPALQSLLPSPFCRLSLDDSLANQSAGIIQSVDVVNSTDEKLLKGLEFLDGVLGDPVVARPSKVTFIVGKDSNLKELVSALKSKGHSTLVNALSSSPEVVNSENEPTIHVIDQEEIDDADLSNMEVVIVYDFPIGIDEYKEILTGMARYTIKGKLHAILTREDTSVATPLAEIIAQCGQETPEPLKQLCNSTTSSSLEH